MSKQVACLVLALCSLSALAAAMTARDRRALPESQEQPQQHPVDPGLTEDGKQICAPTTPCAWVVYKPFIREIEYSFTNNYCECGPGTTCQYYDDDISISAYVHRCRKDTDNHRLPADPK